MAVGYAITVGGIRAASPRGDATLDLVSLECATGFGGGWCRLELGPPQGAAPRTGDPIRVSLDGGNGARKVFTGEVDGCGASPTAWRVRGHDGLPRLARLDPEKAWADTTADVVLADLLAAAGLPKGTVCAGPALRVFHALRGPRGLRIAEGLLARMGADLFVDGDGKVQVETPRTGRADHTFAWGVDLMEVELARAVPATRGIEVRGEGATDATDASKGDWLPRDASAIVGRAKVDDDGAVVPGSDGQPGIRWVDGALGTAAACKDVATAWMTREAARPVRGHILVSGRPEIGPGALVEITDLPDDHALRSVATGATLRARRVVHRFAAAGGFVTRVEF